MKTMAQLVEGNGEGLLDDDDIADALAERLTTHFQPAEATLQKARADIRQFLASNIGSCFYRHSLKDQAVLDAICWAVAGYAGWKHKSK